jgi:hypothetical protein
MTTLLAAIVQGNWGLAMATVPLAGRLADTAAVMQA